MLYFSRWKTISIWVVVLLGVLFALPNVYPEGLKSQLPDWFPKREMTLGLVPPFVFALGISIAAVVIFALFLRLALMGDGRVLDAPSRS